MHTHTMHTHTPHTHTHTMHTHIPCTHTPRTHTMHTHHAHTHHARTHTMHTHTPRTHTPCTHTHHARTHTMHTHTPRTHTHSYAIVLQKGYQKTGPVQGAVTTKVKGAWLYNTSESGSFTQNCTDSIANEEWMVFDPADYIIPPQVVCTIQSISPSHPHITLTHHPYTHHPHTSPSHITSHIPGTQQFLCNDKLVGHMQPDIRKVC